MDYLEDLFRQLRDYPIAVELRHRSWTEDGGVLRLLGSYDVAWCAIDEPKFSSSIGAVPSAGKLGYFRFHGRNAKEWWKGDREKRYNYLYSPQEISSLVQKVATVAEKAPNTFVFFNNHFGAKAVVNAMQMKLQFNQTLPDELPAGLIEQYPELTDGVII